MFIDSESFVTTFSGAILISGGLGIAGQCKAEDIPLEVLVPVSAQKIDVDEGGFGGLLDDGDRFGRAVTTLGDLDLDGVIDIAVGARSDDDGQTDAGAVWLLFMNADGTVKIEQKISDTMGGLTTGNLGGLLDEGDFFGYSIRSLGDLNGDGIQDLTVAAPYDDDLAENAGAIYQLYLNRDGTVNGYDKISDANSGLSVDLLSAGDFLGQAMGAIGDFNGDGNPDVALGAPGDDLDRSRDSGALHILLLNSDGSVNATQSILASDLGPGVIAAGDGFGGRHVANIGDLNGDGIDELAVGAYHDDDGGEDTGALHILFFNNEQNVTGSQKISAEAGGLVSELSAGDLFGMTVAPLGDVDGDGVPDIAVGNNLDDDGLTDAGALFLLLLNEDGTVKAERKISLADTAGFDDLYLLENERFGRSLGLIGELANDGTLTLAVGAGAGVDSGGGAIWLLTFAVPEPSTAGFLGAGLCLLLVRRRPIH